MLIIFSRQTGSITRRVVERWLQTATKVSRHKHLPVCFGSESIFRTPRFEPFGARRDMPDLVAQDALEDARARLVTNSAKAIDRGGRYVEPARLEHHRHQDRKSTRLNSSH